MWVGVKIAYRNYLTHENSWVAHSTLIMLLVQ
jgi:hypothetical protein